MKVSIPVRKTVTETLELPQLPYYSVQYGALFYMITEEQNIIHVATRQVMYWSPNDAYYGDNLVSAYHGSPCTKEEFDNAVAATMSRITAVLTPAKGAVTNTMNNLDPNNAQAAPASEPTTEQVQAVEQEAQEQAMESAEEGSTEG